MFGIRVSWGIDFRCKKSISHVRIRIGNFEKDICWGYYWFKYFYSGLDDGLEDNDTFFSALFRKLKHGYA